MLNEIKLGFKLLKYGYRLKFNIFIMGLIFTIGLVTEIASKGTNYIGGAYFMICAMFGFQFVCSVGLSEYIQSTGVKKKLSVDVPVLLHAVLSLFTLLLIVIERAMLIQFYPENEIMVIKMFIIVVTFNVATHIYTGICYKYFFVGVVIFTAMFVGLLTFFNYSLSGYSAWIHINHGIGYYALIAFVITLVAIAIEYVICSLLYRKPLSEYAFRGMIK